MRLRVACCVLGIVAVPACSGGSDEATPPTSVGAPATVADDEPSTTIVAETEPATESDTTLPPSQAGDDAKSLGPLEDNDLEIETDEGLLQIGDAEVPPGLPAAFPLPADLSIQLATETATDLGFSGTTPSAFDELAAFYASELPAAGYAITSTETVEGVFIAYGFDGADGTGQVAISRSPGGATRTILVTFGDGDGEEATVPD